MAKKPAEDKKKVEKKAKKKTVKEKAVEKKAVKKEKTKKKKTEEAKEKPAEKKGGKAKKKEETVVKKEKTKKKKTEEAKEKPAEKKEKPIEKIKFHKRGDVSEVKRLRKKKPRFVRQELGKLKKLKDKWRAPRGIDSKKADGKRGKGKLPKTGYRNPDAVRGIHPYGFYPVLVHNIRELDNIDTKKEAAIIAASVGRKKRNDIIKSANEKKITILNPRKGEL